MEVEIYNLSKFLEERYTINELGDYHGNRKAFFQNGKILLDINYKNNLKNNVAKGFFTKCFITYKLGTLHGIDVQFNYGEN